MANRIGSEQQSPLRPPIGVVTLLAWWGTQTMPSSDTSGTADMAMASEPSAQATAPTVPIAMIGGYSRSAPVLHPASDPNDFREEVSRGGILFAENCASCHGPGGKGDGRASTSLLPKPANLTAARFSNERLSSVLCNGIPGSSMPPWRQLSTEDLRALVAYIQSLSVRTDSSASQENVSLDMGKALFAGLCASCHGDSGAGNGPAAGALAPAPTNFHLKKPTEVRTWEVLENGVPGTAMPPWKDQLSEYQRRALVEFVRSLYGTPQENSGQ
jgi:cytochrome c oxidase cbb3-type subunit II